jgi:putative ABC transport system permease protein
MLLFSRLMARQPGFTAVAVLTLTLGIGINTAIFSLADGMLFRPLPFAQPDRLVLVMAFAKGQASTRVARVDFEHLRAYHSGFQGIAAIQAGPVLRRHGPDGLEPVRTSEATPNLLPLLGVRPHLGRTLQPGEDEVALPRRGMLTFAAWKGLSGGDPGFVGRVVPFQQQDVEIVGVLPKDFVFPVGASVAVGELLFVAEPDPAAAADPRARVWTPVARLKPGVTIAQAQSETDLLVRQAAQAHPSTSQERQLRVANLQYSLYELSRPLLWLLLGAAGAVLLIACVNLASLLLARGSAREREIGIRGAIGASKARLARQLLVESLVLAAVACALALGIAWLSFTSLVALLPPRFALLEDGLHLRAVAFTALVSAAAGMLFGVLPALRLSRIDVNASIRETRRLRPRRGLLPAGGPLVTTEVALCLVLVIGTALMANSLVRRLSVDLGFTNLNALVFNLPVAVERYPSSEARFEFHERLLADIRKMPGVRRAAAVASSQVGGEAPMRSFEHPALPERAGAWTITPGYFAAMGMPLQGRDFTDEDMRHDAPVAIVSHSIARALWPDEDPLGQVLLDEGLPVTVVGVTTDLRAGYGGRVQRSVYRPSAPSIHGTWSVVADVEGDPDLVGAGMRRLVQQAEPGVVVATPRTLRATLNLGIQDSRFQSLLFLLFGVVALLVAAVGIYGVMAHWVSTRTREVGVRLALGADAKDVKRLVLRQAAVPLVAGLAIGLLAALGLTKQLESLLYEIQPNDPATLAAAVGILLAVGLAAAYAPARRAARVDPVVALRAE